VTENAMTDNVEVLVEAVEEPTLTADALTEVALADPRVSALLGSPARGDLLVSRPQWEGRNDDDRSTFGAMLYSTASGQAVQVTGRGEPPYELEATPSAHVPLPTAEELREAAAILRADAGFAALAEATDVIVYQPMPPLSTLERDDGTVLRRPTLGIYNPTGSPRHRVIAVDLRERAVDWSPESLDHPTDDDCESTLPIGVESLPDAGGPERVNVRVLRNGRELWSFTVVRPRDSEPQTYGKGSGVELRMVRYRGRLVLYRAHVPILNVLYDDGVTYRDWQNQETPFQATGHDPVGPGWRVCNQPPATILESGTDAGNFQGVALWYSDGELRIVSEVQAGWYRYVSDWRLRDDGVIKPRFGFAGTRNPRTCMRHQHHVYWRFDFDIDGSGNDVVERRSLFWPGLPLWIRRLREGSAKRSVFTPSWRVLDKSTGRGYRIVPGLLDGTADAYGVADLWFLRYHGNEIDDGVSVVGGTPAQTQTRLDQFVTGESIDGTDVVIWYAGHFLHDQHHPSPHQGHIVGPELRPVHWN
jgi:hypothetical protein